MLRALFLSLALLPLALFAKGKSIYEEPGPNREPPWLTGPLIAPSSHIVPLGYVNAEPYIYAIANTGVYGSNWSSKKTPNNWAISSQTPIQIGLTSFMNFQFVPTVFWNYTEHEASWAFGDLPLFLDIQLYRAPEGGWAPNTKLSLRETAPTGKYRNLNPKKLGTDAGGAGTWDSGLGVVLGNIYNISGVHYFNYRLALIYMLPAPVHLEGFNNYGGGYGTDGRFYPSQSFQVDFGLEITLAQTWAFAMDVIGNWSGKTRFTGNVGTDAEGHPALIGSDAGLQFSLAPAIEYNWSSACGIIFGSWFSVAGRNSPVFSSGVFALNAYF
jgi:hypothetical protein